VDQQGYEDKLNAGGTLELFDRVNTNRATSPKVPIPIMIGSNPEQPRLTP